MTRFSKLRELVSLSKRLTEEARRMPANHRGRIDRYAEAAEYYAKAEWLAGRLTDEEYAERLVEAADAKAYAE